MVQYKCTADVISKMHARSSAYISSQVRVIRNDYLWNKEIVEYTTKLIRKNENPYQTLDEADASNILLIQAMDIRPKDRIEVVVEGEDRISRELEQLCYEICNFLEGDLENYHKPE